MPSAGSLNPTERSGLVDAALLLTVLIWAVNFSVAKATLGHMPALAFNTIRLVGSSAIMLGMVRFALPGSFSRRELGQIVLLGLVGHTCYQFLFILGLDITSASNSALILGATPVMVAAIGGALGVERVQPASWVGILASVAGIYLVLGSSRATGGSLGGDLLVLAATFCWSTYTVMSKPLLARHGPLKVTAYTMGLGTVFFLPFSTSSFLHMPFSRIPWTAWAGVIFSFVFALSLAYFLWYYAVSRVGPTRTAVYSNLTPAVALVISWFTLGERITVSQVAGAAVIFAGIYLVRRSQTSRQAGQPGQPHRP